MFQNYAKIRTIFLLGTHNGQMHANEKCLLNLFFRDNFVNNNFCDRHECCTQELFL